MRCVRLFAPAVLLLLVGCSGVSQQTRTGDTSKEALAAPAQPPLTVEEVLGWRSQYGELLGKSRDAVIVRYGEPEARESDAVRLAYSPSEKTDGRGIWFGISGSKVGAVKVFPKAGDRLDVLEVIKQAHLFEFDTGVFTDTTRHYFAATTKDKRNAIQFFVGESGVSFAAVIFSAG